ASQSRASHVAASDGLEMGAAHAGLDPAPGDGRRVVDGGGARLRLVARGRGDRRGGLQDLHRPCRQLVRRSRRRRAQLGLLHEDACRHPPPRDGHRRRLRDLREQILGDNDGFRVGAADRVAVVLHIGGAGM
ncbi:MAG: Succinate dehydrogenase cytochrome b-556 subunit, partial [uncultured Sphingosinicella sp.]